MDRHSTMDRMHATYTISIWYITVTWSYPLYNENYEEKVMNLFMNNNYAIKVTFWYRLSMQGLCQNPVVIINKLLLADEG